MAVAQIALHLTDRCQLDCAHCLRDPEQRPTDLALPLIESVLGQAARLHGTRHVSLTGGEPTLHPDFLAVIDAIAVRGMTWHMVSNGRTFGWLMKHVVPSAARRAAMTHVYFSLDGADESTHDGIRGTGSFRDVMAACSLASAHAVPFTLQLVVNAVNQHQIESVGLLAAQLGAARVAFCMLQPTGTPHDEALKLSAGEWRAIADRLDRLRQILTVGVLAPEGWPQRQPFHVCDVFQSAQLNVDVQGHLNLCCQHAGVPQSEESPSGESDVVANLEVTSLAEAHHRLLGVIHRAQVAKLAQIDAGSFEEWDYFGCNWCLKHFGKPHWTADGVAGGPSADRDRWVGAWGAPKNQATRVRLPIVS
jgi:MoaA/NifB/PqqE/SkfB family radical SAM enzyme